jgi:hypothetical protein
MPGRDNGFVARHYVPLADLDPRLADAMLEALRAEGIAAYVVPSAGELGGYLEVHMPERPRDRLWVDREHHDRAAALLVAHSERHAAPEPVDPPDDAWAQLVAGFDLPAFDGPTPWPAAEDLPADIDRPGAGDGEIQQTLPLDGFLLLDPTAVDDAPVPRRIVRPADPGADRGPDADHGRDADRGGVSPRSGEYDPLSILDEHFVPEPPPPLPRLRRGTRWALASILVGVGLIVGRTFSDAIPSAVALGVLAIVGGFVALVAMMGEDRPSDSDPDDGAVV